MNRSTVARPPIAFYSLAKWYHVVVSIALRAAA